MTEQKDKHDWQSIGLERRFGSGEFIEVEECTRCYATRKIVYPHGIKIEEVPKGLTRYCEDTKR